MNSKALSTIEKYSMLEMGDNIIVGFSGGADSSALLHFLSSLKEAYSLNIVACHVNHNIRGSEAKRDENFCVEFCRKRNIPIEIFSIDVLKISTEQKKSVELCARELRYEIFEDLMKKYSAKLATAHTMSDHSETVIWNMARGTGLRGLCGIPALREDHVIRPLIECSRTDIETYCSENNISYVTDSTNLTNDYTRNKIRNQVIPVLKELNPSVENSILRMSDIVKQENEYLESVAHEAFRACSKEDGFCLVKLQQLHPAILSRVISLIVESYGEEATYKFIELLRKIIAFGVGAVEISRSTTLEIKNNVLLKRTEEMTIPYFEKQLQLGEIPLYEGKTVNLVLISYSEYKKFINFSKDVLKKSLDYDRILYNACIRQRCAGDKISLKGRNGLKSLKKLFNESSLSLAERSGRFVICDEKGVIFLEGFGCDKRVQVEENSKKILIIDDSSKMYETLQQVKKENTIFCCKNGGQNE